MAFHLRSISLPSRLHLTETEIKEEMSSLEASISSSMTIGVICDDLRRLGDIYNGVEEIICLPSSQLCSYQQRTVFDGEMKGSLELLDLCGVMQDIFAEMEAIIQELQVDLTKGDDAAAQARLQAYTCLSKKAKNHFKKTTKKISADCRMVRLLAKAREISSLLESTLSLVEANRNA